MTDQQNVALVLNWYQIEGNNMVGEETIGNMSVDDLLKLFNAPFWNNIYHCWALENSQIEAIRPNVKHHIDPEKYAYFVEVYKNN